MISSRPASFLLAGAVHVAVAALAWTTFAATSHDSVPGHLTVVSLRSIDFTPSPGERPDRSSQKQQRNRAAVLPPASIAETQPQPAPSPVRPSIPTLVQPALVQASEGTVAVPATVASSAALAGDGGGTAGREAGEGRGTASSGHAAAPSGGKQEDAYARRVFAWIARHKEYPGRLAREGREGTVLVRLSIAPSGRLELAELVRSSGHDALDRLALQQIREAIPYPRPPRGEASGSRVFVVPMSYRLNA